MFSSILSASSQGEACCLCQVKTSPSSAREISYSDFHGLYTPVLLISSSLIVLNIPHHKTLQDKMIKLFPVMLVASDQKASSSLSTQSSTNNEIG